MLHVLFQISDTEFLQCRCLVLDYLAVYSSQPSRPPRLQLVWTVSRRTLNKLKPSTRVLLDLEPIVEDEVDENDAGLFDRWGSSYDIIHSVVKCTSLCCEVYVSVL